MKSFVSMLQKPTFWLFLGILTYFAFGLVNITRYHTADEHFWLPNYGPDRVERYWDALFSGDFEDTRINDKPGVSTALISGIGIPFAQDAISRQIIFDDGVAKQYDPNATKIINFWFRFPLLLFNGLFTLYFFWVLRKILRDDWTAVWACLFILLSPITLGISQIVNPDTLFWSFGLASLLSFYAYLHLRERRFVWLATVFFGFTLLSKYVGIIFFPFFLVMILIDYLFRFSTFHAQGSRLHSTALTDILSYATVMLGGTAIFAIVMPASIVDPEILYESTVGFPGMLPVFLASLSLVVLIGADALVLKSKVLKAVLSHLSPHKVWIERALFALLLVTLVFTALNWITKNSLVDLTHIPFDAKTKESFTTENPYWARFIAEWVPLTFSLTPLTLFLLALAWTQALFGSIPKKTLVFTLSTFFLVFYIAVIEQGLLVTARYSIILFPLAFILGAIALRSLLFPTSSRERLFTRFIFPSGLFLLFLAIFILVVHTLLPSKHQIIFENILGGFLILFVLFALAGAIGIFWLLKKYASRLTFPAPHPALVSFIIILIGSISLLYAYPHYFIYTNSLLPKRYLLFHSWGYGGYEASKYLNQKPDAENLTIWADAYGVCEFFVGKCVRKQKVDTEKYRIDYMVRTLRGTIAPKFPHNRAESSEWDYAVGGREKNFVRIYQNIHE